MCYTLRSRSDPPIALEKLYPGAKQNIDTLETEVGVTRVLQCHGSFATATCIQCKAKVNGAELKDDIFANKIPLCKVCNKSVPSKPQSKSKKKDVWNPRQRDEDDDLDIPIPPLPKGIMKVGYFNPYTRHSTDYCWQPDIVFFGEPLTDDFDHYLFKDRETVDLLLVIGTSLKVAPVSEILTHVPHSVPQVIQHLLARGSALTLVSLQVLINKTPVTHVSPDVVLLGDADRVVEYLCERLGWTLPAATAKSSKNGGNGVNHPSKPTIRPTKAINHEHVWMFPGADGGKWALRDPSPTAKPSPAPTPPPRPNSSPVFTRKYSPDDRPPAPLDRHGSDRSIKKSRLH
ncbi:NAD-dependent histone deacetylase sir2 [Ceratobasidium sp. 428]|nr:NAD-dependent histone deacetylase sir2 [Ceratobasidium sp. 428]